MSIARVWLPIVEAYIRTIRNEAKREYARAYRDFALANPVTWQDKRGPCPECSYMAAQAVRMHINSMIRGGM